jgi:hypothetical protein
MQEYARDSSTHNTKNILKNSPLTPRWQVTVPKVDSPLKVGWAGMVWKEFFPEK